MVALVDLVLDRLGWRDVERDRQLTRRTPVPHGEASPVQHVQHHPVAEHHFRIEPVDPTLRRDLRKLVKHPRSRSATLEIVGHRKRDFGGTRLTQAVKAGDRHHKTIMPGDQRDPIHATSLNGCTRDSVGSHEAVEAQVTTLRRQAIEELLDVVEVHRRRGLQAQCRPITQQHIPDQRLGLSLRSEHHSSWPLIAHTRPVKHEKAYATAATLKPSRTSQRRAARSGSWAETVVPELI